MDSSTSSWTRNKLSVLIDHTFLKAAATHDQIRELCGVARANRFASVCVNPFYVDLCLKELEGSGVLVCAVVGFPLGMNEAATKAMEAMLAAERGAKEIETVINIGALKSGDMSLVEEDIRAVVGASGSALVRVIIETCYLSMEEKIQACEISLRAGARSLNTSTGFGTAGATVEDIKLMRRIAGTTFSVKASGGLRSLSDAAAMLDAGADRLGTSSGESILAEISDQAFIE